MSGQCVECQQPFNGAKPYLTLECGDSVCKHCVDVPLSALTQGQSVCPRHRPSHSPPETAGPIPIRCSVHRQPVEFFSPIDCRLGCLKCDSLTADSRTVQTADVWRDIELLSGRVTKVLGQLRGYAAVNDANAELLSCFLRTALALVNEVEMINFEERLSLFAKRSDEARFLKSVVFGQKSSGEGVVAELAGSSTIVQTGAEESFVRRLFGRPVELRLLYRASRDGFRSSDFHSRCDNKGPTLCLFRSAKDPEKTFGGFAAKSWQEGLSFKGSKESFLFSVSAQKKLRPFRNFERALFCSAAAGPSFGDDLMIGENASEPKSCRSFLGRTYETFEGFYESVEAQKSLAGAPVFHLADIEVYQVTRDQRAEVP